MKKTLLFIIITPFLYCNAFSKEKSTDGFETWYQSLTTNEKIAQVFVTGVRDKTLSKSEKALLKKWPVGGIIYFNNLIPC